MNFERVIQHLCDAGVDFVSIELANNGAPVRHMRREVRAGFDDIENGD